MAVMQMAKMNQLLGINGDNISFISIINDLLFETQLLYCIKD
jgi:hypothetical protein